MWNTQQFCQTMLTGFKVNSDEAERGQQKYASSWKIENYHISCIHSKHHTHI